MSRRLRLGVVDQSPIHDGQDGAHALHCSVRLAQACEQAGYSRYWIAEHHSTPSYASPAPEIMIAAIAAQTRQIAVGSGGVMLSHYSPFKVAETFSTLEALFPGRIDLGLGRAPGGSGVSTRALAWPHAPRGDVDRYPTQVNELLTMLRNELAPNHPFHSARVMPGNALPRPWLLGSGSGSTELAGALGAGFVLALFIGTEHRSQQIIQHYRQQFRDRGFGAQPQAMLAAAVICADSEEEARFLAGTHTYWKVQAFLHGNRESLHSPEQVQDLYRQLSPSDQAYFQETMDSMVLGSPQQCRAQLEELAEYYDVEEVLAVNVTYRFEDRLRSYQRLADAVGLNPRIYPSPSISPRS